MSKVDEFFSRITNVRKKYSSLNDWELPANEARALRRELLQIYDEFPVEADMFPDDHIEIDYEEFLGNASDDVTFVEWLRLQGL